jgi:HEAT repeat protein
VTAPIQDPDLASAHEPRHDRVTAELLEAKIDRLRRAEEEVRRLQDELIDDAEVDRALTFAALREAVLEGLGEGEGVEAAISLVPILEVLGELEGADVCDLLIDAMGSDEPESRTTAAGALEELAFDRFKEVAQAIERAATRLPASSHALRDLPFVIAEIGEPGLARALKGFLAHKEGDVVAAAIEALAMSGDPASIAELRKLVKDPRMVMLVEEGTVGEQASVGMLAAQAIELLSEGDEPPPPPPRRAPEAAKPAGRSPNAGGAKPRPAGKRR